MVCWSSLQHEPGVTVTLCYRDRSSGGHSLFVLSFCCSYHWSSSFPFWCGHWWRSPLVYIFISPAIRTGVSRYSVLTWSQLWRSLLVRVTLIVYDHSDHGSPRLLPQELAGLLLAAASGTLVPLLCDFHGLWAGSASSMTARIQMAGCSLFRFPFGFQSTRLFLQFHKNARS